MLNVRGLDVRYGAVQALSGADLQVREGEVVAIIGANGAGKSTLMRALSGLEPAAGGEIRFNGQDITRLAAHRRVALGIAQSPEGRQVFADQSVQDNLLLGAYLRDARSREVAQDLEAQLCAFPRLRERRHQLAGTLSGGEQQMLAIGRALMSRPRLLLLDEPSLGLAPQVVKEIFGVIRRLKSQGMTILLVEQMAHQALKAADFGHVLASGCLGPSREAAALLADPAVQEAYLGKRRAFGTGRQ